MLSFLYPLLLIWKVVLNRWFLPLTDESEVWTWEHQCGVAHGLGVGHDESGWAHEPNGESHGAPVLAPPPPSLPPMTHAEMMVELLVAHQESARAMDIMAQAVVGLARGGPGGNGGNGGGARYPEEPSSYQDFLKTHPPTFTPSDEPLDAEH